MKRGCSAVEWHCGAVGVNPLHFLVPPCVAARFHRDFLAGAFEHDDATNGLGVAFEGVIHIAFEAHRRCPGDSHRPR
jgi:hypothetical protein